MIYAFHEKKHDFFRCVSPNGDIMNHYIALTLGSCSCVMCGGSRQTLQQWKETVSRGQNFIKLEWQILLTYLAIGNKARESLFAMVWPCCKVQQLQSTLCEGVIPPKTEECLLKSWGSSAVLQQTKGALFQLLQQQKSRKIMLVSV